MSIAVSPPPLFSPGAAESQAYVNLRDGDSEDTVASRNFVERLWGRYCEYADEHFLLEIRRDFHARFWEMYLTCTLLEYAPRRGFTVSCPKPGPDNLIEFNSRRIWIEAVTATPGDPSRPDSLVERIDGQMSIIPADKIVLRYSNAIATKHVTYLSYLGNNRVAVADSYVVAVCGWPLGYNWASGEMPRFLKALFPVGALGYAIDPTTRQIVDRQHQFRPVIKKANSASVSTEVFLDDRYRGLSAVLHSHAHAFMTQPLGSDFQVAHNPVAAQPVPAGLLPAAQEWRASAQNGGYQLACGSQPAEP
jgi:hypothetical protein